MERRWSLNRNTGTVESARYVPPAGYHLQRDDSGLDLPTRADFRVAWLEGEISEMRKRRSAARKAS
jgi:hypothetical protein